jgi:hypothetical protein
MRVHHRLVLTAALFGANIICMPVLAQTSEVSTASQPYDAGIQPGISPVSGSLSNSTFIEAGQPTEPTLVDAPGVGLGYSSNPGVQSLYAVPLPAGTAHVGQAVEPTLVDAPGVGLGYSSNPGLQALYSVPQPSGTAAVGTASTPVLVDSPQTGLGFSSNPAIEALYAVHPSSSTGTSGSTGSNGTVVYPNGQTYQNTSYQTSGIAPSSTVYPSAYNQATSSNSTGSNGTVVYPNGQTYQSGSTSTNYGQGYSNNNNSSYYGSSGTTNGGFAGPLQVTPYANNQQTTTNSGSSTSQGYLNAGRAPSHTVYAGTSQGYAAEGALSGAASGSISGSTVASLSSGPIMRAFSESGSASASASAAAGVSTRVAAVSSRTRDTTVHNTRLNHLYILNRYRCACEPEHVVA